jgi:hypothetical protein
MIEMLHANKMPRFTCYYEPMLELPIYMHMGPKKYRPCPNVWVEDACKVLGCGFNLKWVVGAAKGVTDNGVTA